MLVQQLWVVGVLCAAVGVPGWLLLRALALHRFENPWLLVPLTFVAGVVAVTVPSAVSVLAGTGMRWFAVLLACWTLLLAAAAIWRARRATDMTAEGSSTDTSGAGARPSRLARAGVSLLSLAAAFVAGVRGTSFLSDSAVHASVIEKLIHLPGARFDLVGLAPEERPIDSAILPVWHHLLALAAWPFEQAGVIAMWSAGAAVALWVPWALAALGWVAVRTNAGAVAGAALGVAVTIAPWREIPQAAAYLAYPGNVTIAIVLPVLLTLVAACVGATGPARRHILVALALATIVLALLHLTYLYHVALAGLGMLLVALVLRPPLARALLAPAGVIALVGGIALAASLPFLTGAEAFNRGSDEEWGEERILKQWLSILDGRGNDIQPGYFLEAGGIALAALLLAVLVLPLVRGRNVVGAMLAVGPLLVLGAAARSDLVANFVSGLGSFPPIPRTYKVVPWVLVLVVLVDQLDRSGWLARTGRRLQLALGALLAATLALLAWAEPGSLLGRDAPADGIDPVLPGWTFDVVLVVLAVEVVLLAVLLVRRRGRPATDMRDAAGSAQAALAVTMTVLVVGACVIGAVAAIDERPTRPLNAPGLFERPPFPEATVHALRELEPGSVVLAEEGAALRMTAVAPVYVPHVRKQSFSTTARRNDYLGVVFFDRSPENRLRYLEDNDVDMIVLPHRAELRNDLWPLLRETGEWERVTAGAQLLGWRRRSAD